MVTPARLGHLSQLTTGWISSGLLPQEQIVIIDYYRSMR